MKNIFHYLFVAALLISVGSCNEPFDDEPTIVTTEDITIDVPLNPLDSYIGTVLGLSTKGAPEFSIINQSVEGAVSMDSNGNIWVADTSVFDLDLNPTMVVEVSIVKDGVAEKSIATLNLIYRDTDGDGVADFEELENNTDLNDPCDPEQEKGYEGYNPTNKIWRAADCDGDGISNGDEHDSGSDPYDPCLNNVATSIWKGNLTIDDSGFISNTEGITSCRSLSLIGDWVPILDPGSCDGFADEVVIKFIPESEGATKGTVVIEDQLYLEDCFPTDFIRGSGVYDEETGVITFDFILYYDGGDPNNEDDWDWEANGVKITKTP